VARSVFGFEHGQRPGADGWFQCAEPRKPAHMMTEAGITGFSSATFSTGGLPLETTLVDGSITCQ
jgi:hypothetical protein